MSTYPLDEFLDAAHEALKREDWDGVHEFLELLVRAKNRRGAPPLGPRIEISQEVELPDESIRKMANDVNRWMDHG